MRTFNFPVLRTAAARFSPKTRQWALLIGGVLALYCALYAYFVLTAKPATPAAKKGIPGASTVNVQAPGAQVGDRERWLGGAGKDVEQLKKDKEAQDRKINDLAGRLDAIAKQQTEQKAAASATGNLTVPPAYPPGGPSLLPTTAPPAPARPLPPPPPPPAQHLPPPPAPSSGLVHVHLGGPQSAANPISGASSASGAQTPGAGKEGKGATVHSLDSFLPVSFTKAQIIGGLDAPTGGQVQSNPQPVLLRLADNAILPNRYRAKVKECFIVGASHGDISSERALIRTVNLTCITQDRRALEVPIQGNVFGEDGKYGVRGRLVTKQGQLIANTLFAGIVGAIGQGLASSSATVSVSPLGATQTFESTGRAFQSGIGVGIGRTMDRVGKYWLALAEKTFPVIEVDAGRTVDVLLTRGVSLEGLDALGGEAPTASDPEPTTEDAPPHAAGAYRETAYDDEDE